METLVSTLPNQLKVENAFNGIAKKITKRNNQYIVTILVTDYVKAYKIADSFGRANSIAKQPIIKINLGKK